MCTFGPFSCIRKGTRRAGADTPHPLPPEGGTPLKKVRCCTAAQKEPQRGADSPASPVRRSSRCCAEVIPLSQNRTLDSVPFPGYNEHKERRCPQTVSPFVSTEITASLCRGGGYFFFVTSKTTVTTPRITKGNGSLDSRPNFRGASALLRGTSRTYGPKRAPRDAPSVCLTG